MVAGHVNYYNDVATVSGTFCTTDSTGGSWSVPSHNHDGIAIGGFYGASGGIQIGIDPHIPQKSGSFLDKLRNEVDDWLKGALD